MPAAPGTRRRVVITRRERLDWESAPITQALAADRTDVRVPGVQRSGLLWVEVAAIATDKGAVAAAGGVIETISFKAKPDQQAGIMGGDRSHSFAAMDTQQKNRIPFGSKLYPNEDLILDWNNGTAAKTVIAKAERTLVYGYYQDLAAPAAAR